MKKFNIVSSGDNIIKYSFSIDEKQCKALFSNNAKYNIKKDDVSFKNLKIHTLDANEDLSLAMRDLYHLLLLDNDIPRSSKIRFAEDYISLLQEENEQLINSSSDNLDYSIVANINASILDRIEEYEIKVLRK